MGYSPLEAGEIRLLRLNPGEDTDPLSGCMETLQLRDRESRLNREYDALSYVWGALHSEAGAINIDGHEVEITKSLRIALARLRLATAPRRIWIDFVCVNHSDLVERNEQVKMMHEIYSHARRTCVSLGQATPDTAIGFRTFETLLSHPATAWSEIWDQAPPLVCAGILDIMNRPWWGRMWCLQEVVVAREVELICGNHSLIWRNRGRDVYRFSRSLKAATLSPKWREVPDGLNCLNPLVEVLRMQLTSGPDRSSWIDADQTPDLLDFAFDMRHRESSDPRDKLFGLFGIAKSSGYSAGPEIDITYHKSNMGVFAEFANTMLPRDPFSATPSRPQELHALESHSTSHDSLPTTRGSADSRSPCAEPPECDVLVPRPSAGAELLAKLGACFHDPHVDKARPNYLGRDLRLISEVDIAIAKGMTAVNLGQKYQAADIFIRLGRNLRRSDVINE